MKAVKKIEVFVLQRYVVPVVDAVQSDTGRKIECLIADWEIPQGSTARVWAMKPSKKIVYNDCSIEESTVSVELTNQMLAETGNTACMIEITSDADVISTFKFIIRVDKKLSGEGTESKNESTALEEMFRELANQAITTLNKAEEAMEVVERVKAEVETAGAAQTANVNTAGSAQVAAVTQEGTDQIASIQMEAESYIRREDANKLAFKGQESGRNIHVEDSAEWGFLGMQGYGESAQVQTTGAQLIAHPFDESTLTRNGITYTDNGDGSVIVNGTATTDSVTYIKFGKTLEAGTYTLSGCPAGGSANGYSLCFGSSLQADIGEGITRDVNDETFDIYIRVKSGTTVNNAVFRPMLNAGDTALPWEPYTGGAPSPSTAYPQEINSKCEARQLFDASTITEESYIRDTDGQVVSVGASAVGMNVSDYIPIAGYDYVTVTTNMTEKRLGAFFGADKSFLQGIAGYGTLAVPENAHYMRLTIKDDALDTCMINAGTTPGAWAPYGKYGLETVVEGENLCNPQALLDAGFVLQEDGSYFIDKANKPYLKDLWRNTGIKGQIYINYDTKHVLYNGKSGIAIYVLYKDGSQESAGTPGSESWVHTDFVTRQGKEVESIYFAYATSSASSYLRNVMISTAQSDYISYTAQTLHTYLDAPLRGIPVSSGGNVTIDGQEYIADYRDWERGKHIQRVRELVLDGSESYLLQSINNNGIANFIYDLPAPGKVLSGLQSLCNMFRWNNGAIASITEEGFFNNDARAYFRIKSSTASTVEEFKAWVAEHNIQLQYVLATPIETDIPPEELAAYRRLYAYRGTTNISNSDDVYTAVTYARDPDIYINNKLAELSAAIIGG